LIGKKHPAEELTVGPEILEEKTRDADA